MPSDVVISHLMVPPSMVRQAKGAASIEHLPAYHSPFPARTRAQSRLPTLEGSFAAHQVKRRRLAIHWDSKAVSVRLIQTGSVPITFCNAAISSGVRGTANMAAASSSHTAKPSSHLPLPSTDHSPS